MSTTTEEIMRYKIQLDDSDVAAQLQEVRSKVDAAIAETASSNMAALGLPFGTSVGGVSFSGAASPDVISSLGSFGIGSGTISGPVFYQNMAADFDRTLTDIQTGSAMIRQDFNAFMDGASVSNAGGLLGMMGYDPMMPVSKADFVNYKVEQFSETAAGAIMDVGSVALGTGLAMIPKVGAPLAVGLFATEMIMSPFIEDLREERDSAKQLRILLNTATGSSLDDQESLRFIRNLQHNPVFENLGFNLDNFLVEGSQMVNEYISTGGFSNVGGDNLFSQGPDLLANLIAASREMNMELLGEKGFLQQMGRFESLDAYSDANSFKDFAGTLAGGAGVTGMAPALFIDNVAQTMANYGPTTMGVSDFVNMTVDASYRASEIQKENPLLVASMGGTQGVSSFISGYQKSILDSPMSPMYMAAAESGMSASDIETANPLALVSNFANYVGSNPLENYFGMMGRGEQTLSDVNLMSADLNMHSEFFEMMFGDAPDQDQMVGYLMMSQKISRPQATAAYQAWQKDIPESKFNAFKSDFIRSVDSEKNTRSWINRKKDSIKQAWDVATMVTPFFKGIDSLVEFFTESGPEYYLDTEEDLAKTIDTLGLGLLGSKDFSNLTSDDEAKRLIAEQSYDYLLTLQGVSDPAEREAAIKIARRDLETGKEVVRPLNLSEEDEKKYDNYLSNLEKTLKDPKKLRAAIKENEEIHFIAKDDRAGAQWTAWPGERRPTDPNKPFDHAHGGYDISGPRGTDVTAGFSDLKYERKTSTGEGVILSGVIKGEEVEVVYEHLQDIKAFKKGETVDKNEVIGEMNADKHLHVQVTRRKDGKILNNLQTDSTGPNSYSTTEDDLDYISNPPNLKEAFWVKRNNSEIQDEDVYAAYKIANAGKPEKEQVFENKGPLSNEAAIALKDSLDRNTKTNERLAIATENLSSAKSRADKR